MTPLKARILLADDHAVVRHGLRMVLDAQPDLEVVAEAGDGATVLATSPDAPAFSASYRYRSLSCIEEHEDPDLGTIARE